METVCAFADLFHASGLRVRIPFPVGSGPALSEQIDGYLSAGWSITAPGCEPGEDSEPVGFALRTTVPGRSGDATRVFLDALGFVAGGGDDGWRGDEAWHRQVRSQKLEVRSQKSAGKRSINLFV